MTDLEERLNRAGERFRQGLADPAEANWSDVTRRRLHPALPVAATAAATAGVVAVATLLLGGHPNGDSEATRLPIGVQDPSHGGRDPEFVVPAPQLGPLRGPALVQDRPCRPADVSATGELRPAADGVVGVVRLRAAPCSFLLGSARLVLLDDAGRPLSVPYRPPSTEVNGNSNLATEINLRVLRAGAVGFAWRGSWCGAPARALRMPIRTGRTSGEARAASVTVPLTGPPPPCRGRSGSQLVAGRLAAAGVPVQAPPPAWSALKAELLLPASTDVVPLRSFRVRLTNTGPTAVALSPCPQYDVLVEWNDPQGEFTSETSTHDSECGLPVTVLPAGGSAEFAVKGNAWERRHARGGSEVRVSWAIAGVPTAKGTVPMR